MDFRWKIKWKEIVANRSEDYSTSAEQIIPNTQYCSQHVGLVEASLCIFKTPLHIQTSDLIPYLVFRQTYVILTETSNQKSFDTLSVPIRYYYRNINQSSCSANHDAPRVRFKGIAIGGNRRL